MIKIEHINRNQSSRVGNKINWIVIHDTANPNPTADAKRHREYFLNTSRQASAHYFVDDKEIIEIIDPKMAAWHCGERVSKNGCTNLNSIGVELCINSDSNRRNAKANMIRLVHYLMILYDIPPEHVCRHYDVTGKTCPGSMSNDNWREWKMFKKAV